MGQEDERGKKFEEKTRKESRKTRAESRGICACYEVAGTRQAEAGIFSREHLALE